MAKVTKEKLLNAALEIFARDGYAGTNLKDIAESVGIVKSALYRHYDSKEAIWEAVKDMLADYYEEHAGSRDKLPAIPQSTDELIEMTMRTVSFTVHDKRIVQIRKLLQTEQFRDEKTRDCANNYFLFGTEAMYTKIFSAMMDNGSIKKCDPEMLAFSYTAPITVLVHFCDRDPDRENEAMEKLRGFLKQFTETYGNPESNQRRKSESADRVSFLQETDSIDYRDNHPDLDERLAAILKNSRNVLEITTDFRMQGDHEGV